jgi:hypothetical protein
MTLPPKFIEELEKVKSDKEYMSRFKNHGEKEWFKNYYHDDSLYRYSTQANDYSI